MTFQAQPLVYSDFFLMLYRLSPESPLHLFQDEALRLLKTVLPFDSSMRGSAALTGNGIDVHTIHLHNQPKEMLQAYEEIKHLDTAAMEVSRHTTSTLGFDANAWFSGKHQQPLREYEKRFEQAHFLSDQRSIQRSIPHAG